MTKVFLLIGLLVAFTTSLVLAAEPEWIPGKTICGKALNKTTVLMVQSVDGHVLAFEKTYPNMEDVKRDSIIASDFVNSYCDNSKQVYFSPYTDPNFCCVVR